MKPFDTVIVVDWSARSKPSPKKPTADSIWVAIATNAGLEISYHRTRAAFCTNLTTHLEGEIAAKRRVLVGFDFPFGYPKGFARVVTGTDDPLQVWQALDQRIEDHDNNANNRFAIARALNGLFPGIGPFWGCPAAEETPDLPAKGSLRHSHGMPERRLVEMRIKSAQPCWKLYTTGSVGSQVLVGLPRLNALRQKFGARLAVSPFETPDTDIVLAEIYPSLLARSVADHRQDGEILDRAQVRVLAQAFKRLPPERLDEMLREGDPEEGWILGLGHEAELAAALGYDGG